MSGFINKTKELRNMRKKNVLVGLLVVCLLASTIGLVFQEARIQRLERGDIIPFNDGWGATIHIEIYRSGLLLSEEVHHNVITNAARSALRGHIADSTLAVWNYLAIGTGTGGDATSTTLVTEYSRYQGTYTTVGSYNFTISFTWTAGNFSGQTITEIGVFNDATAGTMLNYDDSYSRGPLLATDSLQVTANFQVGS